VPVIVQHASKGKPAVNFRPVLRDFLPLYRAHGRLLFL